MYCIYVCVYEFMYVCMYVCMYVHICVHTLKHIIYLCDFSLSTKTLTYVSVVCYRNSDRFQKDGGQFFLSILLDLEIQIAVRGLYRQVSYKRSFFCEILHVGNE